MEEDIIQEVVPDKQVLPALLAYQVLDMLKGHDDAAYRVYLALCLKFGAGQRL